MAIVLYITSRLMRKRINIYLSDYRAMIIRYLALYKLVGIKQTITNWSYGDTSQIQIYDMRVVIKFNFRFEWSDGYNDFTLKFVFF